MNNLLLPKQVYQVYASLFMNIGIFFMNIVLPYFKGYKISDIRNQVSPRIPYKHVLL